MFTFAHIFLMKLHVSMADVRHVACHGPGEGSQCQHYDSSRLLEPRASHNLQPPASSIDADHRCMLGRTASRSEQVDQLPNSKQLLHSDWYCRSACTCARLQQDVKGGSRLRLWSRMNSLHEQNDPHVGERILIAWQSEIPCWIIKVRQAHLTGSCCKTSPYLHVD